MHFQFILKLSLYSNNLVDFKDIPLGRKYSYLVKNANQAWVLKGLGLKIHWGHYL